MSLRDLEIQDEYRSDRHNLIRDFYIPCLEKSVTYSRAVGFFSSSSMAAAAKGIMALIQSGGRMQLVASPHLSEEDAEAIARGLKKRDGVITQNLLQELEQDFDHIVQRRLECLAWLLQTGVLDIKLAIPKLIRRQGLYHEKLGIFTDREGNQIVFTGSANESSAALIDNFECIDVFCSWEQALQSRVSSKVENFRKLWKNQTGNLEVLEFPEAARRSLLRLCPREAPVEEWMSGKGDESIIGRGRSVQEDAVQFPSSHPPIPPSPYPPISPPTLQLRPYQQEAIQNWFANKGRGTLKMATGSGKTITALAIAAELYEKIQLQALIVVCPYQHLVQQWARECQTFGLKPILAFDNARSWQGDLSRQLYNLRSERQPFLTVITTNATLIGQRLQSQLPYFPEKALIVGDEAHNLGSPKLAASLPRMIGLRLALSATPERYFDDVGTQLLLDYFGPVLQPEFTLSDALQAGALVHYRYYPMLIELSESETQRYSELTTKIGRAFSLDEDVESNSALAALSMQRAKLIANATNKLEALRSLMQGRLNTSHTLFYCGDGSVEESVSQETIRQVDPVTRLLGKELGYRVNTYTAETNLDEREELRRQFESGELQGLVAIRCLDEGVDIPATQTAVILASSNNPRQFIQRRGRVLRPAPGKQRADIFDMVVLPPDLERKTLDAERSLMRRELQRFIEFAKLADNAGEARIKLLDLQKRYDLLDM